MSIRYVKTSDNEYVQYRFKLSSFISSQFTNPNNWENTNNWEEYLSEISHREVFTEIDETYSDWLKVENYVCSRYGYEYTTSFDSVQMVVKDTTNIWVKSYDGSQLVICVFPSGVVPTSFDADSTRYRSTDNNLPTENDKAEISSGSMIVVSYAKDSTFKLCGTFYKDVTLNDGIVHENNLDNELKDKINITEVDYYKKVNQNYNGFVIHQNSSCNSTGYIETDVYDSYEYIATIDQSIYFDYYDGSNVTLCLFTSGIVGGNGYTRYRSVDSNLPTESSKVQIPSGTAIVVVIPKNTSFILGGLFESDIRKLSSDILIYKDNLSNELNESIVLTTTLKVGQGKPYTTIKSAIDACVNPSPNNQYIIEFYGNGNEYDLSSETALWNSEHPDEPIGLKFPPYTTLFGVGGKEKCKLALRLQDASSVISPINITSTTSIIGFTIVGNNTRYTVHDDYEIDNRKIKNKRVVKDCLFIGEYLVYGAVWGSGYRSGDDWEFVDVIFKKEQGTSDCATFHNNSGFVNNATLKFVNCRCISPSNKGMAFGTISNSANDIINNIYFYGCKINRLELMEQSPELYGRGILTKVSGFCNDLGSSDVIISVTDGRDYSDYIDLIGKY